MSRASDPALFYLTAAIMISLAQGTCTHFYEQVPLEAGYSPPCDPTGVNIELYCTGYAPLSSSIDFIWMFTPDLNTPYSQANTQADSNWLPSTSAFVVTSGPFAGYRYYETILRFVLTGVQPDIMGYYGCTYEHRSAATTPQFDLSPVILITATPGVTTPCPGGNYLSFSELMSPVLCAETVVTTTPEPEPTTQEITTQSNTTDISDEKACCGHAAYIGVATALFTSICICVVGAIAFTTSEVARKMQKRRHRKLFVDRNVIDPRSGDDHHLRLYGCKACAKLREND